MRGSINIGNMQTLKHHWATTSQIQKDSRDSRNLDDVKARGVCINVYIYMNLCMCVCSYCRHLGRQSVGCSQGLPRQTRQ